MIRSMTGFASASGASGPHSWGWELRSVNGKGLDLRLRVPDWVDGLEAGLRKQLTAASRPWQCHLQSADNARGWRRRIDGERSAA